MTNTHPTRSLAPLLLAALGLALAGAFWLALRASGPPRATPTAPVTYAPTVEAPTLDVAATAAPVTPESFYATQQAAIEATSFARATAQPFPTAGPANLVSGQPASASASRGGLTLQVSVPKDSYYSGEIGRAEFRLSNAGPETVLVGGGPPPFGLTLLDAQGRFAPDGPWQSSYIFSIPPYIPQVLAPGQSITGTQLFYVAGSAPSYALWVDTLFARPSAANPSQPDNVGLRLEAGPLPLRVLDPATGPQLHAELQADHTGWSLRVTDANGQVPPGPFAVGIDAGSANMFMGNIKGETMQLDDTGVWSQRWDGDFGPGAINVRMWVDAPGYITAIATVTVPGADQAATPFVPYVAPAPLTFETFASARLSLRIPLYRLAPALATFDSIVANVSEDDPARRTVYVTQLYTLPGGAWLALDQSDANPPFDSPQWGEARYDSEAQQLRLAGQPAYLIERYGWWKLDWLIGADAFELRAPVGALSPADLLALAASVQRQ